ncbi:winged helix DNA-binding domain-containing protein [Vulgatibacter incomptus]|uniref:Winged helix DNA-binding domain-containing protein n=1 Tax=Vulgatibacter incomptus TaxID=1391653 RepID=A0A0K1PC01_9BACT|nr:winged helix DNA-binding domain-containing protein [Vulgatibacter incomptus]AKU90936.1 hypothetical protein AKJ08_1323 [Vulgatibacter incomptus]
MDTDLDERNVAARGGMAPSQGMKSGSRARRHGVLDLRTLNRALLQRQLLLRREKRSVGDALEHLVGLQAQDPQQPYLGLWSRLDAFAPEELSRSIADRQAVRIALMRSTIHLVTAADCLRLRPTLQPVLTRGLDASAAGPKLEGIDRGTLAAAGRALLEQQPSTGAALGKLLQERWPDRDAEALAHAVRTHVPLVQVPPRGLWGKSGQAVHTTAEYWLGRPLAGGIPTDELVVRYLRAFGPATARDIQTWSGLQALRPVLDGLRPRLRSMRDEDGDELFDVPDAPLPDPDTPAPPRFLPGWDNALLSHADRRRIISDANRKEISRPNAVTPGTILVDGFVRGTWRIEKTRRDAILTITPLERWRKQERDAVVEEGEGLLALVGGEDRQREVRLVGAP